ncbi:50S ribosomal protein L33 [Candidatus Peregrinibacteria bacterium RIFOXYA2_FULL_41_18]|nr:MAG: 50S ribosomal protein L33 [Candidatus Peregrinibacteria bacterium RIFOXYA2_FULL_41_18]
MARGKSTFCTWYCKECNTGNYITTYNKRENETTLKLKSKFCKKDRKHTEHKRKDTK